MRVYGKNSVFERLRFSPESVNKICIEEGFSAAAFIYKKAKPYNIPVIVVTPSKILKMARSKNTQGIIADCNEFEYVDYGELLEMGPKKGISLLFLDKVNDPQNLGAIMRTVACLGKFAIIITTHDSVSVTETVLRIASGGDNFVKVAKIKNLTNAIRDAKEKGYFIAGSVVKGGESIFDVNLPYPLGVVIGSEQKGISEGVMKHLDLKLTIPMHVETLSFNVSHATTIFCYEIEKQKYLYKKNLQQ